jgi:hypothetical protein
MSGMWAQSDLDLDGPSIGTSSDDGSGSLGSATIVKIVCLCEVSFEFSRYVETCDD